jgi:hypothetical protein
MSKPVVLSRRELIRTGAAGIGALVVLAGCHKRVDLTCTNTAGLAADDVTVRQKLAYTDLANDPKKACASCAQFVSPTEDDHCGGCKIIRGPIHPAGSCKAYVQIA